MTERAPELERLLRAIFSIVDRHAERKESSGLLYLPIPPIEMKELRSALEPFRALGEEPRTKMSEETHK